MGCESVVVEQRQHDRGVASLSRAMQWRFTSTVTSKAIGSSIEQRHGDGRVSSGAGPVKRGTSRLEQKTRGEQRETAESFMGTVAAGSLPCPSAW